ncbi:Rho guanine nucleotide exchange factor [Marasmius crinis-equi]|uniref:Rho guanine nucleotide exchange factor n=1 Tax=Marasmius crinis-equi TaxID=585013 RepID=A0ABR3EUE3_9AGAR
MNKQKIEALLEKVEIVLADEEEYKKLLGQRGNSAQGLLDLLQALSVYPNVEPRLRSHILKTIVRLCDGSSMFPKCLSIQNVAKEGQYAYDSGGFGEIWKGKIGKLIQTVCLKVVKVYRKSDVEIVVRDFLREAIIWRQLEHPNVLPFLGLYFIDGIRICLISPWMENGNLVQYLRAKTRAEVNHLLLVLDVANGLAHLHSRKVVHADLKGVNVLVTPGGRACLSDFGLSRIAESGEFWKITSSMSNVNGTTRWMAPELFVPLKHSYESDIYAFACVCYEVPTPHIYTGGLCPFHEIRHEPAVMLAIMNGTRPSRPESTPVLDDKMWSIIERCWSQAPSDRPTSKALLSELWDIIDCGSNATPTATVDWHHTAITASIWPNVQQEDIPPDADRFLSQCALRVQQKRRSELGLPCDDSFESRLMSFLDFVPKIELPMDWSEVLVGRTLLFAARLLCITPSEPSGIALVILLFDDYRMFPIISTSSRRTHLGSYQVVMTRLRDDGTYHVYESPITLRSLVLTTPLGSGVSMQTDGRTCREYTLHPESEEACNVWATILQEQIGASKTKEIFCVRPLEKEESGLFGDVSCISCSKHSFQDFGGNGHLIAVCDPSLGILFGFGNSPEFVLVLEFANISQCDLIEDDLIAKIGLFLFMADRTVYAYKLDDLVTASLSGRMELVGKRQKLSNDAVEFFRAGKYMGTHIVALCVSEKSHIAGETGSVGRLGTYVHFLEPVAKEIAGTPSPSNARSRSPGNQHVKSNWFKGFHGDGWPSQIFVADTVTDVIFLEDSRIVILSPIVVRVLSPQAQGGRGYSISHIVGENPLPMFSYPTRPMKVVRCDPDEYLVCFRGFGVYVDKSTWERNAYIEWKHSADQVAIHPPYILLFSRFGIEVRHIASGCLEQFVPGDFKYVGGRTAQESQEDLGLQPLVFGVEDEGTPIPVQLDPQFRVNDRNSPCIR